MKNTVEVLTQNPRTGTPAEAGDILHGVERIAEYMRELGFEMPKRRCFDWIAKGNIPHRKVGVQIISSKSAIREHFLASIA